MWDAKTRKRLVLLQSLAVLMAVFQYGQRATGQEKGGNPDRILSNFFHPSLTARIPLAGSAVGEWLAATARMNHAGIRIRRQRTHRRYRGLPLRKMLPLLIWILYTSGIRTARGVWCYCSHKLYLYQLILRSVLFYVLTEYGGLVNQMLLMISGDVESNPGPDALTERDLFVLLQILKPATPQWKTLGMALGFLHDQLTVIERIPTLIPEGDSGYIREMLNQWLKWAPPNHERPTVTALATALQKCEEVNLAAKLRANFIQEKVAARDRRLIQRHIQQQGSLKMNSLKMLFCGLPCTGKTATMLRLSNQLRCLDPSDPPIPSTGFEKPLTVEVYQRTVKQSVMITGVGGKPEWKYQDLEQQAQNLYSRILKSSSSNTASLVMASSFSQSDVDSSDAAEEQDDNVLSSQLSAFNEEQPILTSLVKAPDWHSVREKLKAIEDMTILHMMDCGGHPECHEILPLLLEGRALNLIFLNLTHDLDKTYNVVFRGREGPSSIKYESVFTPREVLQCIHYRTFIL